MEDKKVIEIENTEDVIEEEEFIEEKESLLNKSKRVIRNNKKKILAAGALLVTGVIGFALGARSDDDPDVIDGECEEIDDDEASEEAED